MVSGYKLLDGFIFFSGKGVFRFFFFFFFFLVNVAFDDTIPIQSV